jgi:hypothetical protein
MPLPQPSRFSDLLLPAPAPTQLTEHRQLMPNQQTLAANRSAYTPGSPMFAHDLLSRSADPSLPIHQTNPLHHTARLAEKLVHDGKTGMYMIHEYETPQALLCIESLDQHLSDERILEMLITHGELLWGFYTREDHQSHGYFGLELQSSADFMNQAAPDMIQTQISIVWPRHTKVHLLKRLRMLAREGCERLSFWPALVGAIVAADQALSEGQFQENNKKGTYTPAFFANLNAKPASPPCEEPDLDTIQVFARYQAVPWTHRWNASPPGEFDACGKAFFWQELGKALWFPDCVRNMGKMIKVLEITRDTLGLFTEVADQWLNLVSFEKIEVTISGVRLKYDLTDLGGVTGFWGQAVELEYSKVPLAALRYLHHRQTFSFTTSCFAVVPGYDAVYGDALAEKLISEATQRGAFIPAGGFRTTMPSSIPILGVKEMCLWSDGKGLWGLLLPGGKMFHWQPESDNPLFKQTANIDFLSAWNLILAALWHDLVTEGPTIIVRTGDEKTASTSIAIERNHHRRHKRSRSNQHVLHLPSQRVIYLDGDHAWGTPEEIEKIKRQAHQVRGHRRKLLPGHRRSSYALENASRFNFIIPDGYTFVKPHQTGLTHLANTPTTETPILARGLASLMLMSKDYQPRSAA